VSTAAARTSTGALVVAHGDPLPTPSAGLTHLFPTAEQLIGAAPALPGGRERTLGHLVDAVRSGRLDLGPGADRADARRVLAALPGIGPWTVEMVAMRSLGDPDAFPGADLGVRRGAARIGLPGDARSLLDRAERWRPWRAYAVQHLWAATDHPVAAWPPRCAPVDPTAPDTPRPTRRRHRA